MKSLRQMGSGFIVGVVSLLLVIGGISLALSETRNPAQPPTPSPIPTTFAVEFASPFPSSTPMPVLPTDTPAYYLPSATATSQSSACVIIVGDWVAIIVGSNDTLYSIAERYNTTVEELNQKNCLNLQNPASGVVIYVPAAVATKVVIPCGPPAGWVRKHVVQPGENLFRIALSYGITYPQLQAGNCMGSSTTIFVGQVLWVPNVPTLTPVPLPTNTVNFSTQTPLPTLTPNFSTPTSTLVVTSSPVPTSTTASTPIPPQTSSQ